MGMQQASLDPTFLLCEMEVKREPAPGGACSHAWLKHMEKGWTKWLSGSFLTWASMVLNARSLVSGRLPAVPVLMGEFPKQRTLHWKPTLEIRSGD